MDEFDLQFARTMAVIKQLARGKVLKLGRYDVAMGKDMSIGFVLYKAGDQYSVTTDNLSVKDVNDLCEMHGIGMVIPDV